MSEEPSIVNIIAGTLPTPEDPSPSNQTLVELSDGSTRTTTGPVTPQILAEYVAALAEYPEDAGLRIYYGIVLQGSGDSQAALVQFREAVRLDPASQFARGMLGSALRAVGRLDEAICEHRETLRLFLVRSDGSPDQQEAILRWGLAESLHLDDNVEEALTELRAAIAVQQSAVEAEAGSPSLLRQLKTLLVKWTPTDT